MPPFNSNVAENAPSKISFRLKGGLFPLTLLDLHHYTPDQLRQDLGAKVAEAPGFFQQTPVIIGFESFAGDFRELPLLELQEILREHGMIAVALKGASDSLELQAQKAGLAIMPANTRSAPVKEAVAHRREYYHRPEFRHQPIRVPIQLSRRQAHKLVVQSEWGCLLLCWQLLQKVARALGLQRRVLLWALFRVLPQLL